MVIKLYSLMVFDHFSSIKTMIIILCGYKLNNNNNLKNCIPFKGLVLILHASTIIFLFMAFIITDIGIL